MNSSALIEESNLYSLNGFFQNVSDPLQNGLQMKMNRSCVLDFESKWSRSLGHKFRNQ